MQQTVAAKAASQHQLCLTACRWTYNAAHVWLGSDQQQQQQQRGWPDSQQQQFHLQKQQQQSQGLVGSDGSQQVLAPTRQLRLSAGHEAYRTSSDYISRLSGGGAAISSPLQGQVFTGKEQYCCGHSQQLLPAAKSNGLWVQAVFLTPSHTLGDAAVLAAHR